MNHNDRNKPFKNPVGPEQPLVRFDVPLWQVFVALFLIAGLLTALRVYQQQRIAPRRPVAWQAFDLSRFQQEKRSRRHILVWVRAAEEAVGPRWQKAFESPAVRTAVYMNRCLCLQLDPAGRNAAVSDWIDKRIPPVAGGGLAMFAPGSRQPRLLEGKAIDPPAIVRLIEGD